MTAPAKIVLIGAASASFGSETLAGLVDEPELHGAHVVLVDVDPDGLETMAALARRMSDARGAGLTVEHTTDRRAALAGADFVIVSVEADRLRTWRSDWELPRRHGMRHIQGENGGPGGLSHALRTIPLVLEICRDVEAIAPGALVLNYTNPLTRVCLALDRYTDLRVVGLCHGASYAYLTVGEVLGWAASDDDPHTSEEEAKAQMHRVPDLMEFEAAGLNHLAVMTALRDRRTGADLYPEFKRRFATQDSRWAPFSRRFMDTFGLWPLHGDTHVGEFLGWAHGDGPRFEQLEARAAQERAAVAAAARGELPLERIAEKTFPHRMDRAPAIIAATVAGRPQYELGVNVRNEGCVQGLPDWAVVEVPGVVGPTGVRGVAMGALPPGITAILANEVAVQDRVVEAAVHGDREAALQALLLDPVANHDFDAASALLDDLLRTHAAYLPQFARRAD